jgi:hypothetical protein
MSQPFLSPAIGKVVKQNLTDRKGSSGLDLVIHEINDTVCLSTKSMTRFKSMTRLLDQPPGLVEVVHLLFLAHRVEIIRGGAAGGS